MRFVPVQDLVAASATPLALAILAEGDSYGYAIIKRVADLSGGELQWTDGMLYPVLHRLEPQGLVAAKWVAADSGRKRKYSHAAATCSSSSGLLGSLRACSTICVLVRFSRQRLLGP